MLASLTHFRRRVGAFIGGFEAGLANRRLKGFQPSRAHLNTLIAAAGPDITARARWLIRNNGYAANAIESWAGNVVGAGIKPSSMIKEPELKARVQQLWLGWTDEADAEGFTDFYGLQRRAAREVFIAGEVFFRFRPRRPQDGLSVPFQLQMIPSEMLPLNRNEVMPGGNVIRQGIEFDAIGRRVAYHFLRRHPGDFTDPGLAGDIVRVPAFEIVHVIDPVDAGQLRGVSRFAAGIVKLFLLDQYDDAELDRKKVAAMHALFITTPAPAEPLDAAEGRDENDERTIDLQPGQITMLEPGEEVQTSAPADVGQTYEPFQYRTLLQVSAALGVPYAYLSNDMLKANYSNSRLALLEFRRRIEAYQHAVIVWQLCRQVWARWMDTAVLAGALGLSDYDRRRREYLACGWLPPKWDWVDPLKDARAEIEQIDAGLKSRTQALAERGYDAEQVDAEIAADKAREKSLGLTFGSAAPLDATQAPSYPGATGDAEGHDYYRLLLANPDPIADIALYSPDRVRAAGAVLLQHSVARELILPADLPESMAYLRVAPSTEDVSLVLFRNAVQIGTVDFPVSLGPDADGGKAGTFTFDSETHLQPGERFSVHEAVGSEDATAAGLSLTIVATVA